MGFDGGRSEKNGILVWESLMCIHPDDTWNGRVFIYKYNGMIRFLELVDSTTYLFSSSTSPIIVPYFYHLRSTPEDWMTSLYDHVYGHTGMMKRMDNKRER